MPRVRYEREKCIGCAACAAVAPDYWDMHGEKSVLKGSIEIKPDIFVRDIKDSERDINQDAADSCPVECIHLEKD
ncbi:MAG: ferredoxin [Candidatus Woesearchaeota archaeon]